MDIEKKRALDGILKKTDVWRYIQTITETPTGLISTVKNKFREENRREV